VDSKNKFNIDLKILLIIILIILLLLILLLVGNKIAALSFIFEKLFFIFEKLIIKILTGWSNEIVNAIGSWKEYKIYKKAGLVQAEINGKKCLIKPDIDMEQKSIDPFRGKMTNAERMEKGLAPLDKNGKPIQLHHIGQRPDSPLAELTFEQHRTGGNHTILHDNSKPTEVHGDGNQWDPERENHWKNRINI
ncbi:HNH/ENDO VII family nuclease, partial [Brachyspira aalborgi]|uniref:HNH/ENDO VII family nuclease n=1 Tax=Brachyspira aalborgi TaxID=29522 RepID=UPI0026659B59